MCPRTMKDRVMNRIGELDEVNLQNFIHLCSTLSSIKIHAQYITLSGPPVIYCKIFHGFFCRFPL